MAKFQTPRQRLRAALFAPLLATLSVGTVLLMLTIKVAVLCGLVYLLIKVAMFAMG